MVKDHSDIEKGNPLPPHRLLFPINSKGYFICTIPRSWYATNQPNKQTNHLNHALISNYKNNIT